MAPEPEAGGAKNEIGEVEEGVCRGDCGLAGVLACLPPLERDGEHVDAGTEDHIEQAGYGEGEVVAERVGVDALLGEGGEGGVDLGGGLEALVIEVEESVGAGVLVVGVEGAGGQIAGFDGGVVVVPVDLFGGGEVDGPGAVPAVEAVGDGFAGIGGGARGEGLEDVEGSPVSQRPGCEGEDDAEDGEEDWR